MDSTELPKQIRKQLYEHVNSASDKWPLFNFREIWQYRSMISHLVIRDTKTRYKQTVVGLSWTIINPFVTMVLFSFIFGNLANVPTYNIPYPVFTFAALVPWTFFSRGLSIAPTSLVGNSSLVTKVYFPRVIIPLAAVLGGFIDFFVTLVMLMIIMLVFGIVPSARAIIWLPYLTFLIFITTLGLSLWFAALNVRVRDINYIIPFVLQAFQLLSPIAYSGKLVHGAWQILYNLNPLVAIFDGYRWALLNIDTFEPSSILLPTLSAFAILGIGYAIFRRMEPTFADFI